ncbi:MAG: hypothetical protein VXY05_01485 [Pseudomonadota bacterium]|nr:hypothetical protein [Pseudomonadota bacterium]
MTRKTDGKTLVLIDLKNTPGITIKSIKPIAGDQEFAQNFFDQVKVPLDNLVGEIDKGWPLAESLLDWERISNANPQAALETLERYRKSPKLPGKSMTNPLRITYSNPNQSPWTGLSVRPCRPTGKREP